MKTKHNSSSQDSSKKIDVLQFPYKHTTEMQMIFLHGLLPEKHKRLYAASEALKLGHGGISYIATVLNCDRKTIYRGISELKNPETIQRDKIRAKGGGRKKSIDIIPNIDEKFLGILKDFTAGDPMDEKIRWTNLTLQQIADKLKKEGIEVSKKIVKQLFKKHGYTKPIWAGDVCSVPFITDDRHKQILEAILDSTHPNHAEATAWLRAEQAKLSIKKLVASASSGIEVFRYLNFILRLNFSLTKRKK